MATLAKDTPRQFEVQGDGPVFHEHPCVASDIVYEGAAVGEVATSTPGTVRPLVAGDSFVGFCVEKCDNSAGAAGAKLVKVRSKGYAWLTVANTTGVATDLGLTVYASDDNTFTTASTNNSAIGKVVQALGSQPSGKVLVAFESVFARSI